MSPVSMNQSPEGPSSVFRTVISAVKGFALTLGVMLSLSILLAVVGYEESAENTVTLVSMIIGAFFAGASSVDKNANRRLLGGILSGLLFFILVMLASILFGRTEGVNLNTILSNLAFSIVSAIVGAVARINSMKRNRAV